MKNEHRRRVSTRKLAEVGTMVKAWVDWMKTFDYGIHPLHTDVLTLLVFSLKMPAGWIALGWLIAAYLFMKLRQKDDSRPRKRARKVRDHKKCKPPKPVARKEGKRKRAKSRKEER
jgi:hypothetical protein